MMYVLPHWKICCIHNKSKQLYSHFTCGWYIPWYVLEAKSTISYNSALIMIQCFTNIFWDFTANTQVTVLIEPCCGHSWRTAAVVLGQVSSKKFLPSFSVGSDVMFHTKWKNYTKKINKTSVQRADEIISTRQQAKHLLTSAKSR